MGDGQNKTNQNNLSEGWKDSKGNPIMLIDIVDALQAGKSLLNRDCHMNKRVMESPGLRESYLRRAEILDKLKERYEKVIKITTEKKEKPGPKLIIKK